MNIERITDPDFVRRLNGLPPEVVERSIRAKIEETLNICTKHFNIAMNWPTIVYNLQGRHAGWANASQNKIRLNLSFLWGSEEERDEMVNIVLPHEIAHLVQRKVYGTKREGIKSHGREWAYVMHVIGLPADRTHSMKTKAARKAKPRARPYTYECDCMIHKITVTLHRRMQQGRTYTCRECGGQLREVRDADYG